MISTCYCPTVQRGSWCFGQEQAALGLFAVFVCLSAQNGDVGSNLLYHPIWDSALVHHSSHMSYQLLNFLARDWLARLFANEPIVYFMGLYTGGGVLGSNE